MSHLNRVIGQGVAWLTVGIVGLVFTVVVLRYGFSIGWVWLQESYVWMHGLVFMLSIAATLERDEHVRVDIFYRSATPRRQAWINLGGIIFFIWPLSMVLLILSLPYVSDSWMRLEFSREAGGLPGVFILKTVIPLTCILIFLQGLAVIIGAVLTLKGHQESSPSSPSF